MSSSNFDFTKALSDGSDLRFTDDDGTTQLNHWIESYDNVGQTARIWVKVPSIPTSPAKTVYVYYGNSTPKSYDYFKISVDSTAHNDYGLTYPVTYRFSIPANSSNLKAYKRFSTSDSWTQLIEKTTNDFFNGIEAIRFDYTNNKAYISVSFGSTTDDIHIKITDSNDANVSAEYDDIPSFYDNRDATVVASGDDLGDAAYSSFQSAFTSLQTAHIWFSPGAMTSTLSTANYNNFQTYVDLGYIEPSSHTRTHTRLPYANDAAYDSELGGSAQDLKDKLNLPLSKGSSEYVWTFIEPWGENNATMSTKLALNKYLVSRSVVVSFYDYGKWDSTYGLYNDVGTAIFMKGASEGGPTTATTH